MFRAFGGVIDELVGIQSRLVLVLSTLSMLMSCTVLVIVDIGVESGLASIMR